MVKINSRARSMVILNSSDLYLNSVIDKLISAKKKECNMSTNKGITFVGLIQLSENHVGQIIPLVCKDLFERNDDSGINLRRCDSTLCFINKLCSNTFVSLPKTTDILFSNQHHETSNTRKGEESNLNVPQKVEPKNDEYLTKDAETYGLLNKTVNISQCKNVIRGQLTSGIAPTDLRTSIYNKGHQQRNNPIYKKKEKINKENNEWKLSQKKKGPQSNNKMCETFRLTNCEDTNRDALSVIFSGGSSLQSNKCSSTTTAKGKENLSPSLFKSITVSKSLLHMPNHVNKSGGNVGCDETTSVNVDVENVVTQDHDEGFKFSTHEKKNSPRCSEGNQISKKDESFTGYIPSRDLIPSDIAPPNHNSLGIQISNENSSFFDSLSNYDQSSDSTATTSDENYCLTPFEENLIHSQKLGGDSSHSDFTLEIDSGNQNICNKLDNLVQELREVFVYQQKRDCYPAFNFFCNRKKSQNLKVIQSKKNCHVDEKSSTIFVNLPVNEPCTYPNVSKYRAADKLVIERPNSNTKNKAKNKCYKNPSKCEVKTVNRSSCGSCFQTLCSKPSKIPLKKRSSRSLEKKYPHKCISPRKEEQKCSPIKCQSAHKHKNAESYCSFPCGDTFCCLRHTNKPDCNCCNKCAFSKQTYSTYVGNKQHCKASGTNIEQHNCYNNTKKVSMTSVMKDENKKCPLISSNRTPKETFCQTSANSNKKQPCTQCTQTATIDTKVSTASNSNLRIVSKSSITMNEKPKPLTFKDRDRGSPNNHNQHITNTCSVQCTEDEKQNCNGKRTLKLASAQTSIYTSCSMDKLKSISCQTNQPPAYVTTEEKDIFAITDIPIVPVCCSDTSSKNCIPGNHSDLSKSREVIEIYVDPEVRNLLPCNTHNETKQYSKDDDELNDDIVKNLTKKLDDLEFAYKILLQLPDHKSKKHCCKHTDGLKKREYCSGHSKNNCKSEHKKKKEANCEAIRRKQEKIMKDVAGGVELVLESIKEFKKLVDYDHL